MARPRKDPKLKALTGTLRKDREPQALATTGGPMVTPLHLSNLARLQFARIAGLLEAEKRAGPQFADVVALLAQRLEQIERWQAVLSIEGDSYAIASGARRARPEVAMLSDAMRHVGSLLAELMLSPAAALKTGAGHRRKAGAFDDF